MPLATTPPQEVLHEPVVRKLPKRSDKSREANRLGRFVQQEIRHWQDDLDRRTQEGLHLLEWFVWSRPEIDDSEQARYFQRLVQKEIPLLQRLISNLLPGQEPADLDQLLVVQRTYLQFCDGYDRIKLKVLKEINFSSNLRIY